MLAPTAICSASTSVTAASASCRAVPAALIVSLDRRYPDVITEVAGAIAATLPGVEQSDTCRVKGSQVCVLKASHPVLPFAFPQHGPGRKHLRSIALARLATRTHGAHPKALLRGLIHSDGCRTVNRFRTALPSGRVAEYEYPRYFFSNLSADIRRIFCEHCELLGIRWSQSNHRNISVSHRDSVALLDEFVGPKAEAMRAEGLEPPQSFDHEDLNLARLPVPPRPRSHGAIRPGTG